jgi:hypothetical protein
LSLLVINPDGSSNWPLLRIYISELIAWFNVLAADLSHYSLSDLEAAWNGVDPRSSVSRLNVWSRATALLTATTSTASKPAAAPKATPVCSYCNKTGHLKRNCYARRADKKAKRSESLSDSSSEEDTPKAASTDSKKKSTKKATKKKSS